jgi:hypothetical protein
MLEKRAFILGRPTEKVQHHFTDIVMISTIEDLPETDAGLLILSGELENQDLILTAIHKSDIYWSWAIFVEKTSTLSEFLSDGIWFNQSGWDTWDRIQHRYELFKDNAKHDKIIGWLALNPQRKIKPFRDSSTADIYRYPILETYLPELESPARFLLSEAKRSIIESEEMVDRIRVCSQCNGGHLNYIEVCPSCHHFDIQDHVSLHCFTCGYVGEQGEFLKNGKLQCPKCITQLRHIGVDYDRPLETHRCNHCEHKFPEANTRVSCLTCGHKSEIKELVVRRISSYQIGEQGEYILKNGRQANAPELTLKGKVDSYYFSSLLSWVNKLALRHKEQHMLLGIHLPALKDYGRVKGEIRAFALIDQITQRLNGLFRESDICCQIRHDLILVLMPKTNHQHINVIRDKINKLSALIENGELPLSVFAWELPDKSIPDFSLEWLNDKVGEVYAAQ